jgi:hypothetical protein
MKKAILFLVFAVFALAVSPVLATSRLTFNYAVIGNIHNVDIGGSGGQIFLTLKGTLTLGTPDLDTSGWSDWRDDNQGWNNYGGGYDWGFSWVSPYPDIPLWVKAQFTPEEGKQYRASISWDNHEHWWYHCHTWDYRWYTPKGSWSGQLVAIWGATSFETFSVSLSPWRVEKTRTEGNKYMTGDSSRHEHWEIYKQKEGGEDQVGSADKNDIPLSGGCEYDSEDLRIYFNGKFTTKKKSLGGRLDLIQHTGWTGPNRTPDIGINGNGQFGPYSFKFPP